MIITIINVVAEMPDEMNSKCQKYSREHSLPLIWNLEFQELVDIYQIKKQVQVFL